MMKLTAVAVLLLCSYVRGQNTCTAFKDHPECGCTLDDGAVIDLSGIGNQHDKPAFTYEDKEKGYTYTYNPCYPFNIKGGCTDVAGCQQDDTNVRALGVQDGAKYAIPGKDLVISYTGGVGGRAFDVTLKCNENEIKFVFDEENPNLNYKLTLTHPCACPDRCKGGGNGGGGSGSSDSSGGGSDPGVVGIVLLSVFVVAVVAYFVVGMIIMRVKYDKTGTDVVPNKDFWFALPFLVKDGVLLTFSPCIKCYHNRRSGYSTVK